MNILELIQTMPQNLTELEKARYLYIELCKTVTFSTTYQNTDLKTMSYLHNKKVDANNLESREINCRMWTQLYSQLLNSVGIKNEVIDQSHQYVEFHINDEIWVADATYGTYTDLARTKNDDQTVGFGLSMYQRIGRHSPSPLYSEEAQQLIDKMDQKLGYNTDAKENLQEFKEYLTKIQNGNIPVPKMQDQQEKINSSELFLKLEYLFTTIGKLNQGYYEQKDFVRHLEKLILNDEEMKQVGAVELKRTNKDKTVDIVQCIYAKDGGEINYYLLSPNRMIQKCEKEQIIKLAILGYGIENKQIPGIIYPKKFIEGKSSIDWKNTAYHLMKNIHLIKKDKVIEQIDEQQRIHRH